MRNQFFRITLLTVFVLFLAGIANAQIDPITLANQPGFGMIGIGFGQSGKLNVFVDRIDYSRFPPGPCTPDASGFPPGPCTPGPWRFNLAIYNGDGTLVAQQFVTLGLRQAATLDYTPTDVPFAPLRKRIRPVVLVDPDANGLVPCVKQSFELLDTRSQQTSITYQGGDNLMEGMSMDTTMSFGITGITTGQTARLNVVNTEDFFPVNGFPPGPCRVRLSFFGSDGSLLATSIQTLNPGKAGLLDFNFSSFTGGVRTAIRAEVTVEVDANGITPCVMPTLEVFDKASGKTTFILAAS
ncbi:MAG TPA: hypothetical protein VFC63_28750 [Blastocatellia bacterium]|nr:hypothetical protein [Blastocatellia bacterium]